MKLILRKIQETVPSAGGVVDGDNDDVVARMEAGAGVGRSAAGETREHRTRGGRDPATCSRVSIRGLLGAWRVGGELGAAACAWRVGGKLGWRLASTGWRVAGDWRAPAAELGYAVRHWRWRLVTGVATGERRLASGGCRLAKWRPARATGDRRSGGWRWAGGEPRVFGCRPLGAGGWWPGGRGRLRALLSTACAVASRRSI
jgi:hypothetical protein